jgi:hypothetical protein
VIDLVNYSLKIDTAWGSDIDKIIALMSTRRYPVETDLEVKDRMDDWVTDTKGRFQTVAALKTLVYEIAEYVPDIEEYPDVDFMTDYGTPTNYGICRMQVPGNKSEYLSDVATMGQTYVAAGIYLIVESTSNLVDMINNFSDDVFLYGSLSFDESDPGMTEEWVGYIDYPQTESLTSFSEEMIQYGLLTYSNDMVTSFSDDELLFGSLLYTDNLTTMSEQLVGYIDYYETESLTSFSEEMIQYGLLAYTDSIITLSDSINQYASMSYSEPFAFRYWNGSQWDISQWDNDDLADELFYWLLRHLDDTITSFSIQTNLFGSLSYTDNFTVLNDVLDLQNILLSYIES